MNKKILKRQSLYFGIPTAPMWLLSNKLIVYWNTTANETPQFVAIIVLSLDLECHVRRVRSGLLYWEQLPWSHVQVLQWWRPEVRIELKKLTLVNICLLLPRSYWKLMHQIHATVLHQHRAQKGGYFPLFSQLNIVVGLSVMSTFL